jgi:hypothetical protein
MKMFYLYRIRIQEMLQAFYTVLKFPICTLSVNVVTLHLKSLVHLNT